MADSILIVTGIYPPDSGGPAKFSYEFRAWCLNQLSEANVVTYSDSFRELSEDTKSYVSRVNRNRSIMHRYFSMIRTIGSLSNHSSKILSVGAFIETYISSVFYRFSYIAKVPGDIVWERARNNNITNLNIENFQHVRLQLKYQVFRWLYTQSLKHASNVIVPSEGLRQLCLGWGIDPSKLHLIYNSVDLAQTLETAGKSKEYELITVCRLTPWKGVNELIEYSAKSRKRLIVVGDGPERKSLESLVSKLGAPVEFAGDVDSREVTNYFAKSEVFVLNSYYEGLPHALVEARQARLISIGRAGTGSAEVINDGVDGYLISHERDLTNTLDFVFSDIGNWPAFIERATTDVAARFAREVNYSRILKLLDGS